MKYNGHYKNNFYTRYWAITDPMTYPAKMTDKRAVILIFIVWVCSSAISFPAIAWWRETAPLMNETVSTSSTLPSSNVLLLLSTSFIRM